MSTTYQCGDHGALVGYLYDECDADERARIGAHIAACAACAAELAALESTRIQLASWSPPETDLGFAISRPQASGPRPRRSLAWFIRPLPAWAQLAAAVVIFAAGLSLGIAQGTLRDTSAPAPVTAQVAAPVTAAAPAVPAERVTGPTLEALEGQVLARVRALIDESEQRQQRELALRTAQIVRDFDSQRRVDLEQIQRNFGQIEGLTGAEVREQRQMLNYLMRVSQQQ